MPTKTDRILSYLPGTFRALPRPTVLYTVADAFGNELLMAENSLAAMMLAHWVDHADRGSESINDLAKIAALYGLAPQQDETTGEVLESVEEFREHLKRYIRTFLEGTVTVQGILRITAEALGLQIDDANLDCWWQRHQPELVTVATRKDDAAEMLLGVKTATVAGRAAQPAQIVGQRDLRAGVDLGRAFMLRLKVDDAEPVEINLAAGKANPAAVTPGEIQDTINAALSPTLHQAIAQTDGIHVTLTSPTTGAASRLELQPIANDAAELVLGVRPLTDAGSTAKAAQVTGTKNLSNGVDFSEAAPRYLRLVIDNTHIAEIDCAAGNPGHKTLDQIRDAINQALEALGGEIATHNQQFLTLTSPTQGASSSIAFQEPAAQDAATLLFGSVSAFYRGEDAQPARVTGNQDLSQGVDLSDRPNLRIRIDGADPRTINCAGNPPAATLPTDIVIAINTALGRAIASYDGRFITLTSPTVGPSSSITFELLPTGNAAAAIFGIRSPIFQGTPATSAQIVGIPSLSQPINLMARHHLALAVDGEKVKEIDLRATVNNPSQTTLGNLVTAINQTFAGQTIASQAGERLVLTSPTTGSTSRLAIAPLETTQRRRFVTRASITDEATQAIFGFMNREAEGTAATSAQIIGTADLSRGVDLRQAPYLRIRIDDQFIYEVNFATSSSIPRLRAALLQEIVEAINEQTNQSLQVLGSNIQIASHDGRHLILSSPTPGLSSRVALEPPRTTDLLETLIGEPVTVQGRAATQVKFVGTLDLSPGIDLPAHAAIKLSLDGAAPVSIPLTDAQPAHKTLSEIVNLVNTTLPHAIATEDGIHPILTSGAIGIASQLSFETPDGTDVTSQIFGITPPRTYRGTAATPAEVIGKPISGDLDLRVRRYLRLTVDQGSSVEVDCAAQAADPSNPGAVSLAQVAEAINAQVLPGIATVETNRLKLTSPTPGSNGQIVLEPYTSEDGREVLLGNNVSEVRGTNPQPAQIVGEVDLLRPVNLRQRRVLRLAIDGGKPVDIDVAGADPTTTFLDEIVNAINRILPGVASATSDDRLHLTSPTTGENSHLAVHPLRYLEVVEYPPAPTELSVPSVQHGDRWTVVNSGAAEVPATIHIRAPQGVVGPTLVNASLGWQVRLAIVLRVGETVQLRQDCNGNLQAEIQPIADSPQSVPANQILVSQLDPPKRVSHPATAFNLPQGASTWYYLDCYGSRFNQVKFNQAEFADKNLCRDRGVFNLSQFTNAENTTVFASASDNRLPAVDITFSWETHQLGAFQVNLPADLPDRFGARFNEARFSQSLDDNKQPKAEVYRNAVTEPATDKNYLITLIKNQSALIWKNEPQNANDELTPKIVPRVPIGWKPVKIPFRKPKLFTLGSETSRARIYLAEEGLDGFIELQAASPGTWGNQIAISVRKVGPVIYDVTIRYLGARFENARQVVLGPPLPALVKDSLKPGPIGVLQAKAAGVQAKVTRDSCEEYGGEE